MKHLVEPAINRKALADITLNNLCSLEKDLKKRRHSKGTRKFLREASVIAEIGRKARITVLLVVEQAIR